MTISYAKTMLCRCTRCGHRWRPRFGKVPAACAACKHKGWNTKARRK